MKPPAWIATNLSRWFAFPNIRSDIEITANQPANGVQISIHHCTETGRYPATRCTKLAMRFALIAFTLVITACAGNAGGISLRCTDCLEVQVDRVIDGHTLDTSLGRIRLLGVNTPEPGERCYDQATELVRQLLGDSARLEPGPRSEDSSGRLLYYAYTQDGVSVDAALIIGGLGVAELQDGQHRDYLVGLETESRAESTGCIWQSTDLDYGQIASPNFNALLPDHPAVP